MKLDSLLPPGLRGDDLGCGSADVAFEEAYESGGDRIKPPWVGEAISCKVRSTYKR